MTSKANHTHTIVLLLLWNLSGTTRVSRYQKGQNQEGKTNLDLLEQEIVSGSGICQGHMQVCTSSQITTPTSHHSVFSKVNHAVFIIWYSPTCTHTHTTVLLLFWNMSGTTRVSRYQKGKTRKVKTNLDLLEQEIVGGSGICWAICNAYSLRPPAGDTWVHLP